MQINGLYDKIISSNKEYIEKLGIYYDNDLIDNPGGGAEDTTIAPNANEIPKRVITYTLN